MLIYMAVYITQAASIKLECINGDDRANKIMRKTSRVVKKERER